MVEIRTVLCPVDFSALSRQELHVAVEVCQAFGAKLVLHHNLGLAPAALSKSWEWEEAHAEREMTEAEVEERMEALLKEIPAGVRAEAMLSRGLVVPVLLHLVEQLPADLVVLGSHGWSDDEHTSVGDRLVEGCPVPVLTVREGTEEGPSWCIQGRGEPPTILVLTDLSATGERAVANACELARQLPMHLCFLHVLPPEGWLDRLVHLGKERSHLVHKTTVEAAEERLRAQVPEDLAHRVDCVVKEGAIADTMMKFSLRLQPQLIVMGRHARGFFRGLFTRDNSRQVLHRASCPVWFAVA